MVGTDFFVGYEANKTTVICYTGRVSVTPLGDAKVEKNSGQTSSAGNSIAVSAGQMVIISTEIPPGGFQSNSTPPELLQASMTDTNVPDGPPPALRPHPGAQSNHRVRRSRNGMGNRDHAAEFQWRQRRVANRLRSESA